MSYIATQRSNDAPLPIWDEAATERHKLQNFACGSIAHVIDTTTGCCIACGQGLLTIRARQALGDNSAHICRGYAWTIPNVGGPSNSEPAKPAPKSEKCIAESASPTTGIDWEAHKGFMRGL